MLTNLSARFGRQARRRSTSVGLEALDDHLLKDLGLARNEGDTDAGYLKAVAAASMFPVHWPSSKAGPKH